MQSSIYVPGMQAVLSGTRDFGQAAQGRNPPGFQNNPASSEARRPGTALPPS